jgi:hypothetical protein
MDQVLEHWGASIEGVVEGILDPIKDIRCLLSTMPTITLQQALSLAPLSPWDGLCLPTSALPKMQSFLPRFFGR